VVLENLCFGVSEDLSSATATVGEYPVARNGSVRKRRGSVQRGCIKDDVKRMSCEPDVTVEGEGMDAAGSEGDHDRPPGPFGSMEAV
jgi:hypothetical protein